MNVQTLSQRFHGWQLFGLLSVLILIMTALLLAVSPDFEEGTRSAIRATARTSFVLFFLTFTASALAVLKPSLLTRALLRERRFIGLAFAFSHLVHAILIYAYGQLNADFWPGRTTLANIPGSIGYAFIILLALTSFKSTSRFLGAKAWKRLHVVGMWVIAAIFTYSYFRRIPLNAGYALPFALILLATAVRITGKRVQQSRRSRGAVGNVA